MGVQSTKIIKRKLAELSELAAEAIYPQKLVNIRVENSMKDKAMEVPAIREIIEKNGSGDGRSASSCAQVEQGSPPSCDGRSAPTHEEVNYFVDTIAAVVQAEIGL